MHTKRLQLPTGLHVDMM